MKSPISILKLPAVSERVGFKRSKILDMVRKGAFPKPRRIAARAVAWDSREVDAWIEQRLASAPVVERARSDEMKRLAARRKNREAIAA